MKCLSCSHNWKRTKLTEYVSLLASCPNCGSRLLARNDFILSIVNVIKKVFSKPKCNASGSYHELKRNKTNSLEVYKLN